MTVERIGRRLAIAAGAGALLWATGCSKQPPAAVQTADRAPTEARIAPELAQIRAKAKGVRSYQMTMDSGGSALTVWARLSDGQTTRLRVQTEPGSWMLHDMEARTNCMVTEKTKRAVRSVMSEAGAKTPSTVTGNIDHMLSGGARYTTEKLDGMDCFKAVIAQPDKSVVGVWLDKQYGLPRQMQAGGTTVKMVYKQINQVPASEFELPPGTTVTEAPKAPMGHGGADAMPPGHGSSDAMPPGHGGSGAMPPGHGTSGAMPPGHGGAGAKAPAEGK